jgi:glycosyltransferase involved in cell wall biosynthesis
MRIVYATTEFITEKNFDGGLANYLYRLCLSLRELGHEPIVFVTSDRDEVIEKNGIPVHRVNVFKKPNKLKRLYLNLLAGKRKSNRRRLAGSWLLSKAIKAEHARQPIDIIQFTNINGVGYFRPSRIPSVIRLSSFRRKWVEAYGLPVDDKISDLIFFEEAALRRADAVYGPSNLLAELVRNELDVPVSVIETPFFLEVTHMDTSWYVQHLSDKQYLLFFGRLGLMKGSQAIGDMVFDLLETHPNLHLVLIGSEAAYHDCPVSKLLKDKAGVHANRVLHFEKIAHKQLYPVIQNARAVILPSRIDNLSNTCIESMALGQVVIGTEGASFEQLIEDGQSGFLCQIDSGSSLLSAVNKALALSPEAREAIGRNAQLRIERLHPDITVQQLLGFYGQVIENKANNRSKVALNKD